MNQPALQNLRWLDFSRSFLFLFLTLGSFGFFYFETNRWLRLFFLIFLASNAYLSLKNSRNTFIYLLLWYLISYNLYNIFFGAVLGGHGLWISSLLVWLLFLLTLSFYLDDWLLASLLSLLALEIFLSLVFWPIDPASKSLFLVLVVYLLSQFLYKENVKGLLTLFALVMIGIIITAKVAIT